MMPGQTLGRKRKKIASFRFLVIARQRHVGVGRCDVLPVSYRQHAPNEGGCTSIT
jgi:hypothetical protein